MDGFMFSTPMLISPVDVEHRLGDVDDMMENSVARELFSCEAEPINEPYEGMEFESEEAAKAFYNAYATEMGFKARVSSFIRSKRDKTIISRQLVCSREGFRLANDDNNEGRTKRPRLVTRVGCRAMIMVKKQSPGKWVVTKCETVHNHVLGTQGKAIMLDYDPYTHKDEGMMDNPSGADTDPYDGMGVSSCEMVVMPPEGDPNLEPHEGMEFDSEQAAVIFYKEYARQAGFRARVSSYYRSKRDNSIISRLIVCSKEGFRAKKDSSEEILQRPRSVTRVGCKAMIMVKKRNSGKWAASKLVKSHNHVLTPQTTSEDEHSAAENDMVGIEKTLVGYEGYSNEEPYEGMEFESEEAAKLFYLAYATSVGFNMRVSTYYRSKRDKSIISRLFVCSREGFYVKKDGNNQSNIKRPREATRVGCQAMLMVKKNNSGRWVVSKFEKEHKHQLGSLRKMRKLRKRSNVSDTVSKNQVDRYHSSHESPTSRYNNLRREAIRYAEAGSASPDVYNVAMRALQEAVEKVTAIKTDAELSILDGVVSGGDLEESTNKGSQVESDSTLEKRSITRTHPSNLNPMDHHEKPHKLRICNVCKQPSGPTCRSCQVKQIFEQVTFISSETISIASDKPISELSLQGD